MDQERQARVVGRLAVILEAEGLRVGHGRLLRQPAKRRRVALRRTVSPGKADGPPSIHACRQSGAGDAGPGRRVPSRRPWPSSPPTSAKPGPFRLEERHASPVRRPVRPRRMAACSSTSRAGPRIAGLGGGNRSRRHAETLPRQGGILAQRGSRDADGTRSLRVRAVCRGRQSRQSLGARSLPGSGR